MATIVQPYVFSWKHIDADSDLNRLRLVLSALPDEQFVSLLEQRRGKGRDDYPIRPVWNAMLAGIVFQHPSAASLLRELSRNGELRHLCGFNPLLGAQAVPSDDAFGRFLVVVLEQLGEKHCELVASVDELSADKGYDSNKNNVEPFDEYGIKPVIDKRKLKHGPASARSDGWSGCHWRGIVGSSPPSHGTRPSGRRPMPDAPRSNG